MITFYEGFFPTVWTIFLLYWLIKAVQNKSTQRLEPASSRILRSLTILLGIVLMSQSGIPLRWLYLPLWRQSLSSFWLGAAVTLAGLLFAVWARVHLGRNWSSAVTIKQNHELITSGPYALVRHPIYTGILTGVLGTAIALSDVRGFLALALFFLAFWTKFRREEQWMRSQFGETYTRYADRTAALVPLVF